MEKEPLTSDCLIIPKDLLKEKDTAEALVLILYSDISQKFSKDPDYGKDFVTSHQYLLGMLVQAAVNYLSNSGRETGEQPGKGAK